MVFPSVPIYFDPPNWHHQQPNHHHHHQDTGSENPQLQSLPSAAHVVGVVGGGPGGAASTRPGSMADRARLAKIPHPEAPLKCPRCDSPNTKFCYYNNYNRSQPRHFCKTCRRYWTRGGALRNVPVGGGCRRNKKSKSSSSSKSSTANNSTEKPQMGSSNSTGTLPSDIIMGHFQQQQTPQMPLLTSLHNFSQYNNMGNIGLLNFGVGSSHSTDVGFQIGTTSSMSSQQFPFFEHAPNAGLYSYQSEGIEASSSLLVGDNQLRSMASNSRVSEQTPGKMEDHQGLNLSRPFLGISENNQFWSGNNWTDNSSSTNHYFLQNFKL